ncbi:amino acid ABC transporter permease [Rhodoferax saidenbachensis]|uniref:Polar amino acid transport system permease protein n=1 Tax=Rhodoferax saidenbachensis TaxID=1484693 RepID=A0ABU1ZPE5_9BURK|nr:amino acid ABC transporter permease [Rhodoferax saidenbachensis]MDR7307416.1 polar amino acid transport system permease protein [Rhodoferax saidenbachensis]
MFDLSLLLTGPYHDLLVKGLLLSLTLLGLTLVLALPLSLLIALLRLAPSRILNAVAWSYVEAIRNVPLLAHMLFWYFGAPELLPEATREWLYGHNFEAIAALCALTLYTAAFMSEDIRSGIRAVPPVQLEAGRALGFGFLTTMRLVVLPQALRVTVPPLVSQTLNLWKNTSIATVIGTAELMYQAAKVETATFRSFEPFVFATVSYLSLSLLITGLGAWYQHAYPVRAAT